MGNSKILWVDIETTGTNEHQDSLLEIGAVVTDDTPELNELHSFHAVISTEPDEWLDVAPVVRDMHERNGLMADSLTGGIDYFDALADFCSFVETHWGERKVPLAGSGVAHFDRRWLTERLWGGDVTPAPAFQFTYWSYDVGSARRFARLAGVDLSAFGYDSAHQGANKAHRGLDDIRDHVDEARAVIRAFRVADYARGVEL